MKFQTLNDMSMYEM